MKTLKTMTTLMAALLAAMALAPSAAARDLGLADHVGTIKFVGGGSGGGTGGSCYGPNPPSSCFSCDYNDPDKSEECHRQYCATNPEAYTCQNNTECDSGFIGRDLDNDGRCDEDDPDDDGDGLPDECDPTESYQNPLTVTDVLFCL